MTSDDKPTAAIVGQTRTGVVCPLAMVESTGLIPRPWPRLRCVPPGLFFTMNADATTRARFSLPSIIAIIAAIASFFVGAILGLIFAIVAVVCGVIGVIMAFSSKARGGFVSTFAVLAGILGVIAAVIKAVAWFF